MNTFAKRRAFFGSALLALGLPAHAGWPPVNGPWLSWMTPYRMGINTTAHGEGCPVESRDGSMLYFASNRVASGAQGKFDVYRVRKQGYGYYVSWYAPANIGRPVNSSESDYCPAPLEGGWLMFISSRDTQTDSDPTNDDCLHGPPLPSRPASPAPGDIFLAREVSANTWSKPLHLRCHPYGPNTAGAELGPSFVRTAQGSWLYFSSNGYPDSQQQDIYASRVLADGTVLPGRRVAALSSPYDDRMPFVRVDGREIVFTSNRPGGAGQHDIYTATRTSTDLPWAPPVRLTHPQINTSASEGQASISADGVRLYFGRKRTADDPGDIWQSMRLSRLAEP